MPKELKEMLPIEAMLQGMASIMLQVVRKSRGIKVTELRKSLGIPATIFMHEYGQLKLKHDDCIKIGLFFNNKNLKRWLLLSRFEIDENEDIDEFCNWLHKALSCIPDVGEEEMKYE